MKYLATLVLALFTGVAHAQVCAIANAVGTWAIYGSTMGKAHMDIEPNTDDPTQAGAYRGVWHLPNGMHEHFEGSYGLDETGNCMLHVDVILPGATMVRPTEGYYDIVFQPAAYPHAVPLGTPRLAACDLARPYWVNDGAENYEQTTIDGPYGHGEVTSYGGAVYLGTNETDKAVCEFFSATQPGTHAALAWITGVCTNKSTAQAANASNCEGLPEPTEEFVQTPTRVVCNWPLDYQSDGSLADQSSDETCLIFVDADPVTGNGGIPVAQGDVVIQRSTYQQ